MVENFVVQKLNELCLFCGLTLGNIQNGTFSCDGLIDKVVYRGRIIGNDRYNSDDLVSLIQSWIVSDTALINTGLFHFKVDPTCSTSLDSLDSPNCAIEAPPSAITPGASRAPPSAITPGTSRAPPSAITTGPSRIPSLSFSAVTGEAITIGVGFFILLVLVCIVILLSFLLFWKKKSKGNRYTMLLVHLLLELAGQGQPPMGVGLYPTTGSVFSHDHNFNLKMHLLEGVFDQQLRMRLCAICSDALIITTIYGT